VTDAAKVLFRDSRQIEPKKLNDDEFTKARKSLKEDLEQKLNSRYRRKRFADENVDWRRRQIEDYNTENETIKNEDAVCKHACNTSYISTGEKKAVIRRKMRNSLGSAF
jgi:dynactin complex subunit